MQIAKSYGQDDGCAEVIAPDVLLVPRAEVDHVCGHPTVLRVNRSNSDQDTSKQMTYHQIQA